MNSHYWISAPHHAERDRLRAGLSLPPRLATVDAHRRLRGPYTAAGTLLRLLAPDVLRHRPDLADRHYIELQESTPELRPLVPPIERILEKQSPAGEISRYPARLHSLRVAHGLVDFLLAALPEAGGTPRTLVVANIQHADVTDREFLAVALRRIPADLLTLVVCSGREPVLEPPGTPSVSLVEALDAHATRLASSPPATRAAGGARGDSRNGHGDAARRFVTGDCVDDDPDRIAAYEALDPAERAALHDQRAAELAQRTEQEPSLRLGALPYHLMRGTDAGGAGVAALRWAADRCKYLGFYHAAAELGDVGRKAVDPQARPDEWWFFARETVVSLAAGGRPDEAAAVQDEARAATVDPLHHMKLCYETGMLYARHYAAERRDPRLARAWVNQAIAYAGQLPDAKERAFYSVFNRNGLALVETRCGRPDEALRLLDEGIEKLDRELGLGEKTWHRVGLRYNRAQVNIMTGRLDAALRDLAEATEADSDFSDHYFNLGNIARWQGRTEEAIAHYTKSLTLEPPFPEAYYNRGDARLETGDTKGALEDFDRTLELEPGHLESLLARAGTLADLGEAEAAMESVTTGLDRAPEHAHLLCLRGRLLAEGGDPEAALAAVEAALRSDPRLAEAWAVRGELAFEAGDLAVAAAHFDRAIELADLSAFRFNRAVVRQAAGHFAGAADDFEAVLSATGDPEVRTRLESCRQAAELSYAKR